MLRTTVACVGLAALWGGIALALTEQQKVAGDLLRIVGAVPGRCSEILTPREYAPLAAADRAGLLICGKYSGSLSQARATCETKYGPDGLTDWTSRRNFLQGAFQKAGYTYTVTMTCRGDEFIVRIMPPGQK